MLPKGATALDFAYYIHSQVGNHAQAAKINEKLMLLSTPLRGGDQVEIITTQESRVMIRMAGKRDHIQSPQYDPGCLEKTGY